MYTQMTSAKLRERNLGGKDVSCNNEMNKLQFPLLIFEALGLRNILYCLPKYGDIHSSVPPFNTVTAVHTGNEDLAGHVVTTCLRTRFQLDKLCISLPICVSGIIRKITRSNYRIIKSR